MIRSYFGLTRNPFDLREIELLPLQQEIHDTLKIHCQQGGLCLVLGVPGTGKSVIKQSLQRLPENQHLVATVSRTTPQTRSASSALQVRPVPMAQTGSYAKTIPATASAAMSWSAPVTCA